MSGIFKAYDIRGIYPEQIDAELAEKIGRAFVVFTNAKKMLVGDQDSNLRSLSMVTGFIRNPVNPNCSQVPCASASAVTA